MATKKTRSVQQSKISGRQVIGFVGDVKSELKKISWTTKDELMAYTKVVVIGTFVFGMLVYVVDLFVRGGLGGIGSFFRWIIG